MPIQWKIESPEQKCMLLQLARRAACEKLGRSTDTLQSGSRIYGRFGGAFVTFWAGKALRGCVGSFATTDDIASTVQDVTRRSLADPRFGNQPITADELESLDIELSILSALQPTTNPRSLTPVVHGIMVRKGDRSGCFLPKVAAEHGWSAEEFLSNCCTMKAGLPAGAWRKRDTEVSLFTADVFSESDVS